MSAWSWATVFSLSWLGCALMERAHASAMEAMNHERFMKDLLRHGAEKLGGSPGQRGDLRTGRPDRRLGKRSRGGSKRTTAETITFGIGMADPPAPSPEPDEARAYRREAGGRKARPMTRRGVAMMPA